MLLIKDIFEDGGCNLNLQATPIPGWLKHELESVVLNDNVEDIVIWDNACDGEYSAKSAYCCLT